MAQPLRRSYIRLTSIRHLVGGGWVGTQLMFMKAHLIKIYCSKCNVHLYDYKKDKLGHLLKCYKDMIARDYTDGDLKCPQCGHQFARGAVIHNRPANKIIQGSVYCKG